MNSKHSSLARVISTGFVVSLIFSIVLFWANAELRKIGKEELVSRKGMSLSLPLDLGDKKLSDPNLIVRAPRVFCEFTNNRYAESDVFLDILLEVPNWITGYQKEPHPWRFVFDLDSAPVNTKWDVKQGLIVTEDVHTFSEGKKPAPRARYVGPEGFGDTPDKALGRFSDPQLCYCEASSILGIYDIDLQVFFKIDLVLEKVTSKSWVDKSIIATGWSHLSKFGGLLSVQTHEASRWETDEEMKARLQKEEKPLLMFGGGDSWEITPGLNAVSKEMGKEIEGQGTRQQIPFGPSVERRLTDSGPWAMDDQGTIYLIDRDTLLLSSPKGQLPRCGKEKTHDPSRLLAYTALPLFVDQQYFGLVTVSLSRDGSESVMVLLDPQGHEKDRSTAYLTPKSYQYGLITSYARTVLDFAQPLVFSATSSLWGPRIEAITGYRSLFVLPLSMPARIAGDRTLKLGDRYGTLVMWNVLTWCVGLLLAIAVMRDLKQHGMSGKTQRAWLFACMGFGWIAVITYLFTRPRVHFVTCTGCGRIRRTDQAHCLHCEADWAMCDLQVPMWRVVD